MNAKVTIGLCAKNAAKVMRTAFDSISIQDYPHEFLKLIIVDDCSSDNTLSLAMEFAQKTDIPTLVINSEGEGLGAARNRSRQCRRRLYGVGRRRSCVNERLCKESS